MLVGHLEEAKTNRTGPCSPSNGGEKHMHEVLWEGQKSAVIDWSPSAKGVVDEFFLDYLGPGQAEER